jgi:hypothetical protein
LFSTCFTSDSPVSLFLTIMRSIISFGIRVWSDRTMDLLLVVSTPAPCGLGLLVHGGVLTHRARYEVRTPQKSACGWGIVLVARTDQRYDKGGYEKACLWNGPQTLKNPFSR